MTRPWVWKPKKLFWVNGSAGGDVRDYDLRRCVKKGIGVTIQYGSDIMRLSWDDCRHHLENGKKSAVFKSRTKTVKEYRLITIPWEPKNE